MNPRFDLATMERCSEIPACRAREVLSLLIEVDPISGKESEQYPDAYPRECWERVENFSRNYIWREDHWTHHHRIPRSSCGEDVHCRRSRCARCAIFCASSLAR